MKKLVISRTTLTVILAVAMTGLPAGTAAADGGFRLPYEPGRAFRITQGPAQHAAGPWPEYNRHAVDFALPEGTPVLASQSGTVQFEGYDSTRAIQVRIDHGGDRCTQYLHLSRSIVNRGQGVARGQLIGYSGHTGIGTGPHLHWNIVYCSSQRGRETPDTLEAGTNYPVGASIVSQNSSNTGPGGSLDVADGGFGAMRLRGWALDPDTPTASISVHAYIGGPAGVGEGHNLGPANVPRPDIGRGFPGAGENHGFDATVSTDRRGPQTVYLYAIDSAGGDNPLIGTAQVNVSSPDPSGSLDSVDTPAAGTVRIRGWSFDPERPTDKVVIHAYVGGPAGVGEGHALGAASSYRPDVKKVFPQTSNNQGFDITFSTGRRGRVPVYVYALNIHGTRGENPELGHADVNVGTPYRARIVPQPVTSQTSTNQKFVLSWRAVDRMPPGTTFDVERRAVTVTKGRRLAGSPARVAHALGAYSIGETLQPGSVTDFRVRPRVGSTISPWSAWETITAPVDERGWRRTGSWRTSSSKTAYWGTLSTTNSSKSRLEGTAWTNRITLVGRKSATGAKAQLIVDGRAVRTFDTYRPSAADRQVLVDYRLPWGNHRISVKGSPTRGRTTLTLDAVGLAR